MAYKDILPQTNLDAVDIRDTIGCPSNNLADYCAKAKTGGIGGYAFKIVENGYLPSDGYLIEGASPYFNIYSNSSPAEWVAESSSAVYRLHRNIYGDIEVNGRLFNAASYCFDLGKYRGYTHKAIAPHTFSLGAGALPVESGQYEITLGFFKPGDYDWRKLDKNTPVEDLYYSIESSNQSIPHNDSTMTPYIEADDHFGIAVKYIGNYPPSKIKARLALYRKRDTDNYLRIAYLPVESSDVGNTGATIEVDAPSVIKPPLEDLRVNAMVITKLIGHPYLSELDGYTVGTPESTTVGKSLQYRIRWKPDLPIKRSFSLTGNVKEGNVTANATVGMAVAPRVSQAEAEASGGSLQAGDVTWYFSGAVDITELELLRPRPSSLILNVENVPYDPDAII